MLRNRHFLHAVDVLPVDQSSENRLHLLVVHVCAGIFLHGEPRSRYIVTANQQMMLIKYTKYIVSITQ